jgi:SPP1 family predicted phage head-tail adaptor
VRPPRAGKYNRVVTLQTPAIAETFDTFSQPVQAWTTVGTYSAAIRPLMGREAVAAMQIKAEATHIIEMRYNPAFTMNPLDQLLYTKLGVTRTFGIISALNVEEANIELSITVQEILTQAVQV